MDVDFIGCGSPEGGVGLGGGVDSAVKAEWRSYVVVVIVVWVVGAAKVDLDRVVLCADA